MLLMLLLKSLNLDLDLPLPPAVPGPELDCILSRTGRCARAERDFGKAGRWAEAHPRARESRGAGGIGRRQRKKFKVKRSHHRVSI
jgi:hypothetical protein